MIEQLASYLSQDELSATVARAKMLLEKTRDMASLWRLAYCACNALSVVHASARYPTSINWSNFSVKDEVLRFEAHLLKLALKDSNGRVTRSARLLGLSGHQSLQFIINSRQKNLRSDRTPILSRKRSFTSEQNSDHVSDSASKTKTIRILHVDDNQAVASMIKDTLESEGWQVEACADGSEALERITSDAHYDLLLLDYDLPGLNGIELLQRARALVHRRGIP